MKVDFAALQAPFPAHQVSWRLQRSGSTGTAIWARVVPYIDTRYIYQRLDDVCGPAVWRTEQRVEGDSLLVGLSILTDDGWVTKWDGTGFREASQGDRGLNAEDAMKASFTVGFRRVAAMWGIARYIYFVPEQPAARCYADPQAGRYYAKPKKGEPFSWDPPALEAWALPGGDGVPPESPPRQSRAGQEDKEEGSGSQVAKGKPASSTKRDTPPPTCPRCHGPLWDNRKDARPDPQFADLRCKDRRNCKWSADVESWQEELLAQVGKLQEKGRVTSGQAARAVSRIGEGEPGGLYAVSRWIQAGFDDDDESGDS